MNQLSELKIQILINSIRKRPGLYDKSHELYKDTAWRARAWKEIAQNVNANEKDCRHAYRSIRDQLQKSLRSPSGKTKYKYYEMLTFLVDAYIADKNKKQYDEYMSVMDESSIAMDSTQEFAFETCTSQSVIDELHSPENELLTSFEIASPTKEIEKTNTKNDEVPTESLKEIINSISTIRNTMKMDNVELFFKSVANTVKSYNLSTSQIAVLQCEVLNFVTERLEKIRTDSY